METRPKILVGEDETLIRLDVAMTLHDAGYDVIECAGGREAVQHLEANASTVAGVFTDVNMPGEPDGITLAHHAYRHWPWVRLLVTSGLARPCTDDLPNGARFIAKPYSRETLLWSLRQMVPPRLPVGNQRAEGS